MWNIQEWDFGRGEYRVRCMRWTSTGNCWLGLNYWEQGSGMPQRCSHQWDWQDFVEGCNRPLEMGWCVCMCVCTWVCVCLYASVCIGMCAHAHASVCACMCAHTYVYVHTCACTCTCIHVCACVGGCVLETEKSQKKTGEAPSRRNWSFKESFKLFFPSFPLGLAVNLP